MLPFTNSIVRTAAFIVFAGACTAACSADDEAIGPQAGGDPAAQTNTNAADAGSVGGPGAVPDNGVPPPRLGLMGEAEISEYFTRVFELTDENDVLVAVNYIPIGNGNFEHHSFSYDIAMFAREIYRNMMPNSRELTSFSQMTADGFFALGSHVCIHLFNSDLARPTRKAMFGVETFNYDADVSREDAAKYLAAILDHVIAASSVDMEPMRADLTKIMLDEFDEATTAGMSRRDALEETCSIAMGSMAPYLL